MTLGEIKKQIAMLVNVYSTKGTVYNTDDPEVSDVYNKMNAYVNMAQKSVAETKHIKRSLRLSHYLPLVVEEWQLMTYQHTDADICFEKASAHAYCFSLDGNATVYIEGVNPDDTTTNIHTLRCVADNGFEMFKNKIYAPIENEFKAIRLRFSGSDYYNVKDIALFDVHYSNRYRIPNFGKYITYEMPSDFKKVLSAKIRKFDEYEMLADFVWNNPKQIAIDCKISGEILIEYAAEPNTIDDDTDDSREMEVDSNVLSAVAYYAAALLMQKEDYAQSRLLMESYDRLIAMSNNSTRLMQSKVRRR